MLDGQDQGAEHRMGPCSHTPMGWWVPHTPASTELVLLGSLSLECPALSPSHPQPPRVSILYGGHGASFAGGVLEKETSGQGVKFLGNESCHARQQQSWSKNPLISIPRARHFFRREAPTFSSQSKYQALILCVNRLTSAATDDCSFGKFIVAIKRVSLSLSLPSPSLFC